MTLALRIIKVNNDESTTTIFINADKGSEFTVAEYIPVSKEIFINDSIVFPLGKVYVQNEVMLKHHFFIFSEYFEKSPNNGKYLTYNSDGLSNKHKFVLIASRTDTTFQEMSLTKAVEPDLNNYSLNNQLIDLRNIQYDATDYESLDTLKFYIKKATIKPFNFQTSGKVNSTYNINKITLDKTPVDSVLFVKKK
ncbi:hypothetical protein AAE02nite_33860 [Adhaeribacter aerolatus]|uniref:Uncharacterized protein n=2 Tax=Adhaeribacter aerolatus TaxID=670289 RepID=A0A512B197_9BACT|nr:hypothetical protein AAE02nite_33860 [Adhaeribacter aerolatus]